ncbi:MAG: sigma-54 dependent transcriptional regulator [Syntrophobacteraceae bacterium]
MSEHEAKVFIADDEEAHCSILSRLMRGEGFEVLTINDGKAALDSIASEEPDVLLLDFKMPGMNGMQVLTRVKETNPELPVIMITGYADVAGAVDAMRAGAHDYLAKPFNHYEVVRVVRRALAERRLREEIRRLSTRERDSCGLRETMGPSDAICRLMSDVNLVARSDFSVLILGETGSGKELVARAIERGSPRKGLFVPIDCGSIPEALLESELFGHEKGAFTGAVGRKPGKFEMARGGTLFLDEISNMPMASQAKLLRAIQEKKAYPVGARQPVTVDARLLAASNMDLLELTKTGAFRLDLFFRLNEFCITIPPLRERREDIPYLAKLFLEATNRELDKKVKGFSRVAVEKLHAHDWPGNVRQLRSVIRRAVLMADEIIHESHLEISGVGAPLLDKARETVSTGWKEMPLRELVRHGTAAIERGILIEALRYTGGNKAKAARLLKVDYKTMFTKVKLYGIQMDGDENGAR